MDTLKKIELKHLEIFRYISEETAKIIESDSGKWEWRKVGQLITVFPCLLSGSFFFFPQMQILLWVKLKINKTQERKLNETNPALRGSSNVRVILYTNCCCCSVTQLWPALCDPMDCSRPGFPVLHYLLVFAQTHVHWIHDAIQPSHPLLPASLPALSLSKYRGLFQ